MILGCKGAPPYLIYGRPRTGKSITLVETIPKLFKTRNDTKMLVCAPSNSAADYLVKKIVSKESKMVVVIAGDPMQLGQVIYSKQADKLGLGKSYLERLFESEY
ncbi:hypothetical protein ACFE04_002321 [Oxalis oulophora]